MTIHFTTAAVPALSSPNRYFTFRQTVAVAAAVGVPMRQIKTAVSGKWKMQQQQINAGSNSHDATKQMLLRLLAMNSYSATFTTTTTARNILCNNESGSDVVVSITAL